MALNEPFRPLYRETAETVRDRLLSALPAELSRVEGSFARDILEVAVFEFTRLWDEMNRYLSYTFPTYAYGQILDAHAASYGLERGIGRPAETTIRFTGTVGTLIPTSTVVSVPSSDPDVPRAFYETTHTTAAVIDSSGYVEVGAIAQTAGAFTNQATGAITFLETPIDDITAVTNPTPAVGGEDAESDDDLRERVLLAVSAPTGSGTKVDYIRWGLEVPGVSEVTVQALWDDTSITPGAGDGAGTVRLSLRGPNFAPVDWTVLQETQKTIDPSRQMIALLEEGEAWVPTNGTVDWDYVSVQTGASSMRLVAAGAGIVEGTLSRQMDLSRFGAGDALYLWIHGADWALINDTSFVRFAEDSTNYFQASFAEFTPEPGMPAQPASGSGWWLLRIELPDMEPSAGNGGAGAPSWSAITSVTLGLDVDAATSASFDYWTVRSTSGAAGEGRAPIGAAVTVVTPVTREINVSVAVETAAGYTLTGAPGTTNITGLIQDRLTAFLITQRPGQTIRVVDVANAIHDTPGVVDFTLTTPAANIPVTMHEYAVLGTLTVGSL
jgi:uncharacterized phage protein gp47/JayE